MVIYISSIKALHQTNNQITLKYVRLKNCGCPNTVNLSPPIKICSSEFGLVHISLPKFWLLPIGCPNLRHLVHNNCIRAAR